MKNATCNIHVRRDCKRNDRSVVSTNVALLSPTYPWRKSLRAMQCFHIISLVIFAPSLLNLGQKRGETQPFRTHL
jgi:hypothetical protein